MDFDVPVRVKGGLPLTAHCHFMPAEKECWTSPGFPAELEVRALTFKSGHFFNMDLLSPDQLDEVQYQAWDHLKTEVD